jgi:RNA recognition motif-containing protein
MYNTIVTDPSNPLVDQTKHTHITRNSKKHKPTNKTVVVHASPSHAPKIIIEQSHRHRLLRKKCLFSVNLPESRTGLTSDWHVCFSYDFIEYHTNCQ